MPLSKEEIQKKIEAGAATRAQRAEDKANKEAALNTKITAMAEVMSSKQVLAALKNIATMGKHTDKSVQKMQFFSKVGMKKIEDGKLGDEIEDKVLKKSLPAVDEIIQSRPSEAWKPIFRMVREVERVKLEESGKMKGNFSGVFASRVIASISSVNFELPGKAGERGSR